MDREMKGPTRNHGEILLWAERHGATPAEISPYVFDSAPSILRFVFHRHGCIGLGIREISWEDFFARFDLMRLTMVYDESPHFEFLQVERPLMSAYPKVPGLA